LVLRGVIKENKNLFTCFNKLEQSNINNTALINIHLQEGLSTNIQILELNGYYNKILDEKHFEKFPSDYKNKNDFKNI
jgi:hypothetical protein